ncbi:MAG: recombinase family protein [Eisenbergiella sp.]
MKEVLYVSIFSDKSFLPGAIYLRLSKDDEGAKESLSIANQRKMLLRYAAEHGLTVIREYVDDGYSGTSFDRPGFKRMIEDIEKGDRTGADKRPVTPGTRLH